MAGYKINRRKFFRIGSQTALGAALAAQTACLKPSAEPEGDAAAESATSAESQAGSVPEHADLLQTGRREVPTTCELCPNKCSVIAVVEDGRIRKLNPNTANPKSRGMLCARGNAGIQQVYDPQRIKRPMIRTGERGEGKWKTVSWDEAFDYVAGKLVEIKENYGPEGTIWSSSEGFQEKFFKNLCYAFGSPNTVRHPSLCLSSVNLAYSSTFGTVPSFDLLNANYVILCGANRFESFITPDTMDLIESTMNRKTRLVCLDPRFTVTASKADTWFPIRPGTDMAFILGMLHVIIEEKRYNPEFIENYTYGFEKLAEHIEPYTPAWAARETEIPEEEIVKIAREFSDAAPRAIFYAGRRASWYHDDFQARRAQAILNAIVGNWDQRGGMVPNEKIELGEYLFFPWDDPTAERIDQIEKNYPLAAKNDGVYLKLRDNILAGRPYPVKGWMVYKQDPMNALPNQGKTLEMLRQMDFVCTIDIQMSDTAWYSDVVLPESTYLERLDPVEMLGGIWPVVLLRQPVIPPVHDTKSCLEIAQGLAERLDLIEYFDYTMEEWIEEQAKELPLRNPLEYLKKNGVYAFDREPNYGRTLNGDYRFITKTGKIELYSDRLEEHGYDPMPIYTSPVQPPFGKLRMVLGRKAYFTHANNTNMSWLNAFAPENNLWIHPVTARSLSIEDQDLVEVSSTAGTVRLKAKVTQDIRHDCVFMLHGYGKHSPMQRLVHDVGASDAVVLECYEDEVSGNAAFHETFVTVKKV